MFNDGWIMIRLLSGHPLIVSPQARQQGGEQSYAEEFRNLLF